MNVLRQNTAATLTIGPFVSDFDGKSPVTGLVLTPSEILLASEGAASVAKTEASDCAEDTQGLYRCPIAAADVPTVGILVLNVVKAGALPVRHTFQVMEEAAYDNYYAVGADGTTNSGRGAHAITVRVTDGTGPLQDAYVRLLEGSNLHVATTNSSGLATFSLDVATWAVAVTKSGYSFTPTTRTVTGEQAGSLTDDLEMTAMVIPPAADPDECTIGGSVAAIDEVAVDKVQIRMDLVVPGSEELTAISSGKIIARRKFTIPVDRQGNIGPVAVPRNDTATPSGSYYRITSRELGMQRVRVTLDSPTFDIGSLIV